MSRITVLGLTLSLFACKGDPKPPAPVDEVSAPVPAADAAGPTDVAAAPADAAAPSDSAPAADTAAPSVADTAAPSAGDGVAAADTVVTLVSNGAEPRVALRYTAKVDEAQASTVTMTTTMALKANGQDMDNPLPKTRLALTSKVAAVDAEGAKLAVSIDEADVDGALPEGSRAGAKLAEVVRGMKGMRGTKVTSLRGVSSRFVLAYPEGQEGILATAALKPVVQGFERAIDQMTVPFPEEAVGVGASWEVSQAVVEAGMHLTQKTTFTLDKIEGDTVTVRFTVVLSAPPGPLESEVAGGVKADVKSLASDGSGSLTVSLGKLMPLTMTLTNKLAMSLELGGEGDKRALDVTMGVSLEATSK